jgi:hypothetical protein
MTRREFLDAIEEEHGIKKPEQRDVENVLRAVAFDPMGDVVASAIRFVDDLDVRDRDDEREKLFASLSGMSLRYSRTLPKVEDLPKEGRPACDRPFRCSRLAGKLVSYGGKSESKCWQHAEDAVDAFARRILEDVFGTTHPTARILGYHETRYRERATENVEYVPATEIWRRLAERVAIARSFLKDRWLDDANEQIEKFESKWGPIS